MTPDLASRRHPSHAMGEPSARRADTGQEVRCTGCGGIQTWRDNGPRLVIGTDVRLEQPCAAVAAVETPKKRRKAKESASV